MKVGEKIPRSLKNIFEELNDDLGYRIPNNGYLKKWANQGVLLLNTVLTVRKGERWSHKTKGWENFTDRVISLLNEKEEEVIFVLWGNAAKAKRALVTSDRHCVIESWHPSSWITSRTIKCAAKRFRGSKPFSKVNDFL